MKGYLKSMLLVSFMIVVSSLYLYAGDEFLVSGATQNQNTDPAVGMSPGGEFTIVWSVQEEEQDVSKSIYAQAFNKYGGGTGSQFKVDTDEVQKKLDPSVCMDGAGCIVATWTSFRQDGSYHGIFAQKFGPGGGKIREEFLVNTTTTLNQTRSVVAANNDGDFVVVWVHSDMDAANDSIRAQCFVDAEEPSGDEFVVNTDTFGSLTIPAIAMDYDGNFVIAWAGYDEDRKLEYEIFAQRLGKGGSKIGNRFKVNTETKRNQYYPSVAMSASGDFVIVWHSTLQDLSFAGVYGQRFDAAGNRLGEEFQVNTHTNNNQWYPSVGMDWDGNFVVSWTSDHQVSDKDIFAQKFNNLGEKVDGEFLVNTHTEGNQQDSRTAMSPDGDFVITWMSENQADAESGWDIYARHYYEGITPGDVSLELTANKQNYTLGDKIEVFVKVDNASEYTVDLYIALQFADIIIWYPAWTVDPYPTPITTGVWDERIMSLTVIPLIPEGDYTFYAALTESGGYQVLDLKSVTITIK